MLWQISCWRFLVLPSAQQVLFFKKKGLLWIDYGKNKQEGFIALFSTWLFGAFLSYFIAAIPIGLASKVLSPHIITAMSGWGIVVIVFLSFPILKERIYPTDILYSLIIVGCTLAIGLLSDTNTNLNVDRGSVAVTFLIPFFALVPAFFKFISIKIRASLFAVYAGSMGGLAIVFFNLLVRQYFSQGFFSLPRDILILYIITAVSGAVSEQASYKLGQMTVVASIRLGFFIIYPVFCSFLLFYSRVDVIQVISILLIILSCYGIFKKR